MSPATSTLEAMRQQEEKNYICRDYLYHEINGARKTNVPQNAVNVGCRTSMLQWTVTVVDFCGFDNETMEISMNYLDRFLQTPAGVEALSCRNVFQLAAMTSLYTAIKINSPEALTPSLLAELSQGAYTAEQVEEMELIMLQALGWCVNPPTAASFVREIMSLIPSSVMIDNEDLSEAVYDIARVQCEYAVGDYELVTVRKSVIAISALANAFECLNIHFDLNTFLRYTILCNEPEFQLEMNLKEALMIKKVLRQALPQPEMDAATSEDNMNIDVGHQTPQQSKPIHAAAQVISPRCVSMNDQNIA